MRSIFNLLLANALALLFCYNVAVASTLTRPYGSFDYAGGRPAVGPKVNSEFDNIVNWINGGNIASSNIAGFGISTGNIANNAVTRAKQAAVGQQQAVLTQTSIATTADTFITGTVTITTTGRPVIIFVGQFPAAATSLASQAVGLLVGSSATAQPFAAVGIYRDTNIAVCSHAISIQKTTVEPSLSITVPASSIYCIDPSLPAGTHTFQLKGVTGGTTTTLSVPSGLYLTAFEL